MNSETSHTEDFAEVEDALLAAALQVGQGGVIGVGVDIVEIERIATVIKRTPSFVTKVFTPQEIAYCETSARPAVRYADRFAVREAVVKALGCGIAHGIRLKDIWVETNEHGKPFVHLEGKAQEIADALGVVAVHISISNTKDFAVANAVAVTSEGIPKKDDTIDPKKELEQTFKEARSILDDLGA